MSQRQQLRLVFKNSKLKTKPLKINSLRSKDSPDNCSLSPLLMKMQQLEKLRPAVAGVIERLVDDVLADTFAVWPPLE